jgi:hypothetical protein
MRGKGWSFANDRRNVLVMLTVVSRICSLLSRARQGSPKSPIKPPAESWNGRETHLVARSGKERLGQWVSEERHVSDDYSRAIGTPPAAIVAVWLIGVSIFAHTTAYREYSALELATHRHNIRLI